MVVQNHQINIVANEIVNNEATMAKYGTELINQNSDDPFWVCNLQECLKRYIDFEQHSPRVEQFYGKIKQIPVCLSPKHFCLL